MKKTKLSTLLLALLPLFSTAQINWMPLAKLKGVNVGKIVAADDGHLIIQANNGFFHSLDNGDTWTSFNDGVLFRGSSSNYNLVTAPNGKVYYCNGDELFRIKEDKTGWLQIPYSGTIQRVFVNPQGHVFIKVPSNTTAKILKSTDDGDSFAPYLDNPIFPNSTTFLWYGNGNNFATSNFSNPGKIYRISEDGANIELLTTGVSGQYYNLLFHGDNFLYFLSTTDKLVRYHLATGVTELVILDGNAATQPTISRFEKTADGKIIAYSDTDKYISDEERMQWTVMDINSPNVEAVGNGFAFSSGTGCQLLRSANAGLSWEHLENKFEFPQINSIYKDRYGIYYVKSCTHTELLKSKDGGATWEPFLITSQNLPVTNVLDNKFGFQFVQSGNRIFAAQGDDNWTEITPPNVPATAAGKMMAGPTGKIFFTADNKIFCTANNGNSWLVFDLPPAEKGKRFLFPPNGDILLSSSVPEAVYVSKNDGQDWEQLSNLGPEFVSLSHVTPRGHIYFLKFDGDVGTYSKFVSYDNLQTYRRVTHDFPTASDADGNLYRIYGEKLLKSEDEGLTWLDLNVPAQRSISAMFLGEDQNILVAPTYDFIYQTANPVAAKNVVIGRVWHDADDNCQLDAGEQLLPGWKVKSTSTWGDHFRLTNYEGEYALGLPDGNFTVSPVPPNADLWETACLAVENVHFEGVGDTVFVDFPVKAKRFCPIQTVDISTARLRRCFPNTFAVQYCNAGNADTPNATVQVTLDSFLVFENATAPLQSQNGNVLIFSVGELKAGQCRELYLTATVSCESSLGQEHCYSAEMLPADCFVQPESQATECRPNTGSFDPNDKMAFVNGRFESERVAPGTELEYLIRFQNTGTDTAFTVVVEDRLSPWLDPSSVRPGASSHPYEFEIVESRLLRFTFKDILLPDSNINETASNGFVKFSVAQLPGAPRATKIDNYANIFFDFNPPVTTNTVRLKLEHPASVKNQSKTEFASFVYPNPFGDATVVEIPNLDAQLLDFQLFDSRGVLQRSEFFKGNRLDFKRKVLPSGLYFYHIKKSGEVVASGKFIVH